MKVPSPVPGWLICAVSLSIPSAALAPKARSALFRWLDPTTAMSRYAEKARMLSVPTMENTKTPTLLRLLNDEVLQPSTPAVMRILSTTLVTNSVVFSIFGGLEYETVPMRATILARRATSEMLTTLSHVDTGVRSTGGCGCGPSGGTSWPCWSLLPLDTPITRSSDRRSFFTLMNCRKFMRRGKLDVLPGNYP